MVNIVITKGTYGYMPQNGVVEPKCVNDPPFSVTEEEAERLIGLKVAKYSSASAATPVVTVKPIETAAKEITASVEKDIADTDAADDADDGILEYTIDSDVKLLRNIGKKVGISFKFGSSKADMVAKLDEYFENDKAPITNAEDPVV